MSLQITSLKSWFLAIIFLKEHFFEAAVAAFLD
jgi:hypothetical protein